MPLITRQEKGSELTITEMDGNLFYLNNGTKLLCKKTVNLNPSTTPLEYPTITTGCLPEGPNFTIGETITNELGGTAIIISETNYVPAGGLQRLCASQEIGINYYEKTLQLSDVQGDWTVTNNGGMQTPSSIVGDVSEINTNWSEYIDSYIQDEELQLDSTGTKFIVTQIILTNKIGTAPAEEIDGGELGQDNGGMQPPGGGRPDGGLTDSLRKTGTITTASNGTGYAISSISLEFDSEDTNLYNSSTTDNNIGSVFETNTTNITVSNTLHFSVNEAEGVQSTADLYVYGYILE